jgi:hypothetical protein
MMINGFGKQAGGNTKEKTDWKRSRLKRAQNNFCCMKNLFFTTARWIWCPIDVFGSRPNPSNLCEDTNANSYDSQWSCPGIASIGIMELISERESDSLSIPFFLYKRMKVVFKTHRTRSDSTMTVRFNSKSKFNPNIPWLCEMYIRQMKSL